MIRRGSTCLAVFCVLLAAAGARAQQAGGASAGEPGPLDGGEHGGAYQGPGFSFQLAQHWRVTLDEVPAEQGVRGDRGTVRPAPGSEEAAADAMIRFEPFPTAPGSSVTVQEFEAQIRRTLAAGVPVASLPLIPTSEFGATGDEPEGVTLMFTRPGADGTERTQRRYFVHAYPRPDGRVQTLVCSHLGAPERRYSATFQGAGQLFVVHWPLEAGVFRRDDLGIRWTHPSEWRRAMVEYCGNAFHEDEAVRRRSFMPVTTLARRNGTSPPVAPGVELTFMEERPGTLEEVFRPAASYMGELEPFEFSDGGQGWIAEKNSVITVVREHGRSVAQLRGYGTGEERDRALAVMRGLRLVDPLPADPRSGRPKTISAQGVAITYPGDWAFAHDRAEARAVARLLAGRLGPIERPARNDVRALRAAQLSPDLHVAIDRLDDLVADREILRRRPARNETEDLAHEERPFTTDSGLSGWEWTFTSTVNGKRGLSMYRGTTYVIPLPDGVTALCLAGGTVTNNLNTGSAERVERVWREIARSVRIGTVRAGSGAPAGTIKVDD